jgi:hypothetical protein
MGISNNRCLGYNSSSKGLHWVDTKDSIVNHDFRGLENSFFIWGNGGTVESVSVDFEHTYFAITVPGEYIYIPSFKAKLVLDHRVTMRISPHWGWTSSQRDTILRTRTALFLSLQFKHDSDRGFVKITNINILEPDHPNYQELLAISTSPEHSGYLLYYKDF